MSQYLGQSLDNDRSFGQPRDCGLEGIAVYNPASIGGAGVKLAIDVLNGETPETTTIKRTTAAATSLGLS